MPRQSALDGAKRARVDRVSYAFVNMACLGPFVFGAGALVAMALAVLYWSGMRSALAALTAELARRGIRYQGLARGAALDFPLRGIVLERDDGVRASLSPDLSQGAATLPGFGPFHPPQTLVEIGVDLPDHMICAPDRAQAAFGALPAARLPTGNASFDRRFGVYLPGDGANGYRSMPAAPTPWARSASAATLFSNFDTLGFVALHVHGGRARILFAPHAVDGLVAAMDTAALLARPHEARPPARHPSPVRTSQAVAIVVAFLGFISTAMGIPATSYLTQRGHEFAGYSVVCPKGGPFIPRYRNHPPRCNVPSGASYLADEDAYRAWRFAVFAPYSLAIVAAAAALYFKHRRDAMRVMHRNLTS